MYFSDSHLWVTLDFDIATIGITKYAQEELGDIVYIQFPNLGKQLKIGDESIIVESTKAATDIYTPLSGIVTDINNDLQNNLNFLNTDPERQGWLMKLKLDDLQELKKLMTLEQYQKLIEG